jgi:hypothetical protein
VRIDPERHEKFKEIAKQRDLTVSQELRHYIQVRIEAHEALAKKEPA